MSNLATLHPILTDKEYWDLRVTLVKLQHDIKYIEEPLLVMLDLIEDLNNYLAKPNNPFEG